MTEHREPMPWRGEEWRDWPPSDDERHVEGDARKGWVYAAAPLLAIAAILASAAALYHGAALAYYAASQVAGYIALAVHELGQ